MKLCIIEGKGRLGYELATQLQMTGQYEIHMLEDSGIDRINIEKVDRKLKQMMPEVVIYSTEISDVEICEQKPEDAFTINAYGAKGVAEICASIGAKMIYISTDLVFNGEKATPYNEDDLPDPVNVYGKSKYEGEKEVGKNLKEHYIIRTARIFGQRESSFVNTVLSLATNSSIFKVIGDQKGSCTFIKDLGEGIHQLLSKSHHDQYGIYHFVNTGSCTWYEMAQQICLLKNINIRLQSVSSDQLNRKAEYPLNSSLANNSSFKFRPWEEALAEYILKG